MILTGRWVYKKYKKRRAEKAELNRTAPGKHGERFQATQEEISNTAVEHLGGPPDEAQRSDLPPSYSRIEQDSLTSPTSILHPSSSVRSAISSYRQSPPDLHTQEASLSFPPHAQQSPITQTHLPGCPTPASPLSPQLAAGQPTEIQVHGKWVWVPDNSPQPSAPTIEPTPHVAVNHVAAVELPTADPLKELPSIPRSASPWEENRKKGFHLAELDGKQLSAGDSDKEVYVKSQTR